MNVLIVEDEGHTAALLREMIEQDADFVVTETLETVVDGGVPEQAPAAFGFVVF